MSVFSLPRAAISAQLLLTQGVSHPGEVYVMERVPHHDGPETVLEMLNRPEGFFAFRRADDDGVLLVSKAHTISVAVDRQAPITDPARLSAARQVLFEVALAGGVTGSGWGGLRLPEQHSRLLYHLNASPAPFFAVSAHTTTHYPNPAPVLYG